jgi:CDP-diacylglycerol--glycerol-3-phosphate 3-phosphatidyltransferase
VGGIGSSISAALLYGSGHFFAGSIVVALFVLFDLFDGAMARLAGTSSRWGALLDSTLDRIADASIFGAMAYWFAQTHDRNVSIMLGILVASYIISYIKARAEALDIECNGGIAERSERLVLILIVAALHGLGIAYIFTVGIWLLLILSLITVLQRLSIVYKGSK